MPNPSIPAQVSLSAHEYRPFTEPISTVDSESSRGVGSDGGHPVVDTNPDVISLSPGPPDARINRAIEAAVLRLLNTASRDGWAPAEPTSAAYLWDSRKVEYRYSKNLRGSMIGGLLGGRGYYTLLSVTINMRRPTGSQSA
jgi:hypothetical protein